MLDDLSSVELDPKEIDIRVSKRQRCRYLRNISPPYDANGRCKDKNGKTKRKKMRKSCAARRACSSWLGLFFLLVFFFVTAGLFLVQNGAKYSQSDFLNKMLKNGFGVNKKLFICGRTIDKTKETTAFVNVSDFSTWKLWLHSSVYSQNSISGKFDALDFSCSNVILNSIRLTKFTRNLEERCKNLPLSMQKLLADTKYCNNRVQREKTGNNHAGVPEVSYIDLTTVSDKDTGLIFDSDKSLEIVQVDFVMYNKASGVYSLVTTSSSFSNAYLKRKVTIQSVFLEGNSIMPSCWLLPIYLPLLISAIYQCLSGVLLLLEYRLWSKFRGRNGVLEKPFKSGCLRLVDFCLWFMVLAYLFVSSLLRHNVSKSAEILEKSGHLLQDPESVIDSVIECENILRWILGVWSVLLAIKFINIAVSHHGVRSRTVRSITAVLMSLKQGISSVLAPFFIISLIISLLVTMTSLARYSWSVASNVFPKSFFAFWLILSGKSTRSLNEVLPFLNSKITLFYLVMIFIFTRLILKGFLVATYQWYLRKIEGQTCFSLSELLRKKRKGTNNKTRCQKSFQIGQSHRAFHKHMIFKDMFAEVLSIMKQLFSVCSSSFIFLSSRLCGCSCHSIWQCIKLLPDAYLDTNDTDSTQNSSNPEKDMFKECAYDKTKLDEDYFTG